MHIDLICFNIMGNHSEHTDIQNKLTASGIKFTAVPIPDFKVPDNPTILYRIKIFPHGDSLRKCIEIINNYFDGNVLKVEEQLIIVKKEEDNG